jgi:hypothetical protein
MARLNDNNITNISGKVSLPSGAASSANQEIVIDKLEDIITELQETAPVELPDGIATESTLLALKNKIPSNLTVSSTRLLVDNSGVIQPVSGTYNITPPTLSDGQSLNLQLDVDGNLKVSGTFSSEPTVGAATEAKQDIQITALESIDDKTPTLVSGKVPVDVTFPVTQQVEVTNWPEPGESSGGLTDAELRAEPIDVNVEFPTVQPVSGTFWQATQPVSGPLTDTQLRNSAVPVSGPLTDTQLRAAEVPVSIATMPSTPVTGTFWQATQPVSGPLTDAQIRASALPISGTFWQATQPVSAASLPLPSGAATSSLQSTGNTSLSNIDTKTPALGQALAAASVPVVLTAAQISTLTPLSTVGVTGTFWQALQPVSGPLTDTQLRATAVPVSGTFWQTTQPVSIASMPSTPVTGAFWQATQPISAASLPLPSDAATQTTLSAVSNKLPSALVNNRLDVNIGASPNTLNVAMAEATVLFKGRASTFNTPGRAGTAGQKILSLHNATGSSVTVTINKVMVDLSQTVVKAITVAPPIIRLWKVTVLPTNGTVLTKTKIGGTTTSNASVTVLGDASADGTGSGTTLTATLPTGTIITQEYAPRFVTAAGYEMADRIEFLGDSTVTLAALEGVVLFLDYTLATQNPTTDRWIATIEWTET